jgi:FkbM family methyltransferase
MELFLPDDRPLLFDVGANVGQTVRGFRAHFPKCIVHSFEPSPSTFETLRREAASLRDVHVWNCALGSAPGHLTLLENAKSTMSSFLPLSEFGWGTVTKETSVEVKTVDQFCQDEHIEQIDILKSDTQGFELEVFKGAEQMMRAAKIRLVYFEVIFSDMYKGLPSFAEQYEFLTSRDYLLVSLYEFRYQKQLASWTDALFVHRAYSQARS